MKIFSILVVEDDDVDFMNVERSFNKINIANPVIRAKDGIEAMEKLRNNEVSRPVIIFLDLSMPRMNGHEFLQELRSDDSFKNLPVIVMTVSNEESDKTRAYDKHIQGYVVKPIKFDDFVDIMAKINAYWMMCELP